MLFAFFKRIFFVIFSTVFFLKKWEFSKNANLKNIVIFYKEEYGIEHNEKWLKNMGLFLEYEDMKEGEKRGYDLEINDCECLSKTSAWKPKNFISKRRKPKKVVIKKKKQVFLEAEENETNDKEYLEFLINRKKKIENTKNFHWDLINLNDFVSDEIQTPVIEEAKEEVQEEPEGEKDIREGMLIRDINVIRPHLRFQ